jgi:DNA replication protein DnaC
MSNLQHERLTALAQELRLLALPNLYGAVAQNFTQRQDASFADFLEAILRAERAARRVRSREMLTRTAGFPILKTLDDYDFAFATGAPRQQIQELAALGFVERAENIVLLRPSGTGKTHLAIAFGLLAAGRGWKVRFTTAADLVIALEAANRQGRLKEVLHRTVARLGRLLFDDLTLALIGLITPDIALVTMQQVAQHRTVMHIRRRRHHRMDDFGTAIDAKMRLHAEIPLVALLGLVHLRVAGLLLVLGRTRRVDNGCVHNRAARKPQAFGLQMFVDKFKHPPAKIMRLQKMPEAADRRLVGHWLAAKVDADKTPHRERVVERLFGRGVRQIKPLL